MTVRNFLRLLLVAFICWVYFSITSCSPRYTEAQARKLYGCKTDSIHVDSTTVHKVDTFTQYVVIPADTVTVNGPCEEIYKMLPGEKKQKKSSSGRATSEYGKDSAGISFFTCYAQEYKDSMEWYRETWRTTVQKTVFQSNPIPEPDSWVRIFDYARNVLCIIGLIAIVLLVIKYRSQ